MADEFERFMSVVPTVRQRAIYWLMYGCGLRAGEVYNLMVANTGKTGGLVLSRFVGSFRNNRLYDNVASSALGQHLYLNRADGGVATFANNELVRSAGVQGQATY